MSNWAQTENWRRERALKRHAKRLLRQSADDAAVWNAIRDGAKYGLDISQKAGLRPGRLYPALDRLEDAGMVIGRFEPQPSGKPDRRAYYVTGSES